MVAPMTTSVLAPVLIPGAPTGLAVGRTGASPQTIQLAWEPVAGAHHYDVRAIAGGVDRVYRVLGDRTSFDLPTDDHSDYQLSVGARNSAGVGGTSRLIWERSLVPGRVSRLDGDRIADRTRASVSWQRTDWHGYQIVRRDRGGVVVQPNSLGTGLRYRADLVRRWDNAVLDTRTATASWLGSRLVWVYSAHFTGLDRDIDYVVRVCAVSDWFGTGNVSEVVLERVTS
jgi:hypothetical protein